MIKIAPKENGDVILLVGQSNGHIGCTQYLSIIEGREEGAPPPVDLELEKKNGDFVRKHILDGNISACHDISDGGLFVSLAEMAMASGKGMNIALNNGDIPAHAYGFGEDQARYVLSVSAADADVIISDAAETDVKIENIGVVGGEALDIEDLLTISVKELLDAHASWMPNYMSTES